MAVDSIVLTDLFIGQTVSVHFHAVLNAVLKLHSLLLVKPQPVDDNCNMPDGSFLRWEASAANSRVLRDAFVGPNGLLILACALLHNFIRTKMDVDPAKARIHDLHQETTVDEDLEYIYNVEVSDVAPNMFPIASNSTKSIGSKLSGSRRSWAPREEEVLLDNIKCMYVNDCKADNRFRPSYLNQLGDEMIK
ncbi:hypothetical protein BUALT_Bualt16G0054500 [Buddleja alternifolia]|uniref:Uncharacterized protein n=1 Tax=Buddleja alternifolia TaxID=168488 RepID=A0AAV6WEQ7_9LAMI|nr:hypothetical protein BUALT_Bualt16G0054500 [Buddleja alternifolia]